MKSIPFILLPVRAEQSNELHFDWDGDVAALMSPLTVRQVALAFGFVAAKKLLETVLQTLSDGRKNTWSKWQDNGGGIHAAAALYEPKASSKEIQVKVKLEATWTVWLGISFDATSAGRWSV